MEEVQPLDTKESDVEDRIRLLENEKKKIREEFDSQRAKMKDLYLQKEDELQRKLKENLELAKEIDKYRTELDDVKSQLCVASLELEAKVEVEKRKASEEIASLQQIVHETVEESSSSKSIYNSEVNKLRCFIEQLERENYELKNTQEHSSLAPSVVLSAVTKKLKKFGADAFTSQDSPEESTKIREEEDIELLKSLVEPLEEEIKALKGKLRATDEQLQKCRQCGHLTEQEQLLLRNSEATQSDDVRQLQSMATNTSFDGPKYVDVTCDMCSNYEAQLVKEQQISTQLRCQVTAAEKAAERHREDLLKEIGFRKDMEEKWNEKREEHKQQVAELTKRTECAELDLKEIHQMFKQACDEVGLSLQSLKSDREHIQQELEKLQNENDNLVGKYSLHSQQLQSEIINLPNTVEELHEYILKSHQELIIGKIGKEQAEDKLKELRSELDLKDSIESSLHTEIANMKEHFDQMTADRHSLKAKLMSVEKSYDDVRRKFAVDKDEYEKLVAAKKLFEEQNNELRTRVASLQQELDTSEQVQKDFVRLSQSLQVQLEKIRDSDTQVRWQHDEDIDDCPSCRSPFSVTKRKQHCRHCGQIFCVGCLSHMVPSGPHQRPSKVCDVCHTLLVKSSAPYFSTEVPHSPD